MDPMAHTLNPSTTASTAGAPASELRLAVITMAAQIPDLTQPEDWAEALRLRALIDGLRQGGYQICGVLGADACLPERLAELAPDVLIVDAESGARDAIEHVVWASRDAPRPIVLFTDEHDPAHVREAVAVGVVAYVVAGLSPERVRPVMDVAMARFEHERGLKRELAQAREQIDDLNREQGREADGLSPQERDRQRQRELIARAKAVLMRQHELTEPQAYARLRKTAMNQSATIADIAQRLLDMAELFG
jgi:response regulator NasT